MPTLLLPPNPAPPEDSQQKDGHTVAPALVRSSRFGELNEHELVRLLDTIEDEAARARFRESIYISVIICLAIGWFIFYGPQVIFHQPRLINPADAIRQHEKDLTFLDVPPDVAKLTHKPTDKIAEKAHTAQTVKPELDKKTLAALQAMRQAPPSPAPAPAPAPAAQTAQAPTPTPLPQVQKPLPQNPQTAMVDAPKPTGRPNFGTPQSAGSAIQQAARNAGRGGGANYDVPQGSHGGEATGVDVLSDTEGVDFGPYIARILREVKQTWLPLLPEEARPPLNKQGETQIRFSILPNGKIGGMTLEGSTHDDALNRAAWGSITGVGQFPPLPGEFKGPQLELRIHYLVNKSPE